MDTTVQAWKNGGILKKMIIGAVPILVLGSAIWFSTYSYYMAKNDHLIEIRRASLLILREASELGEEQASFLNEDIKSTEFYRTGKGIHIAAHAEHLTDFQNTLSSLCETSEERVNADARSLHSMLENHQILFEKLVQKCRERGFWNGGLEAQWVGALEQALLISRKSHNLKMEKALIEIFHDETNYLYRDDLQWVEIANSHLDLFKNSVIPRNTGNHELIELLNKNQEGLNAYAAIEKEIGLDENQGLRAEIAKSIDDMEAVIRRISEYVNTQAVNARHRLNSICTSVLVLMVLFEMLAFYFLARSISRPLMTLSTAVSKVREGNTEIDIEINSKDEVGLLASTFREMLQNLTKTQKQLLQAQKLEAIGTLAGGIAHDFNNLLSGILAYAGIIKKRLQSDEKTVRDLTIIEQSAERGAELTKQLLGYARKGAYEKKRFSLNDAVLEARKLLYRTIDKTITVKADLEDDLDLIEGDSGQILQALMNLGINARDAMPEGGELWIESQNMIVDEHFSRLHGNLAPGNYVRLSISDTGTGMPKEIQSKIFDPFFTTKEVGKGTGLGLSMVYGIMQNHRGVITVYSEIGRGTRFHLYFPSVAVSKTSSPSVASVTPIAKGSDRMVGQMVLVVDDEALMRNLAKDVLESEGATLFFATNGEEALAFLEKNHSILSLILLDVIMPKMDGVKTYNELRKLFPTIPVIFSSGYSESEPITKLRKNGNVDFIQKPYRGEDLIAIVLKNTSSTNQF